MSQARCWRITNATIDKLQIYYGLAIRKEQENLEGMTSEIMAGLHDKPASINLHVQM